MRIWSIHPKYLDAKGLVALWREALLAKKVLEGRTKGYKNHPQLDRFKKTEKAADLMNLYLIAVYEEASSRGYAFDKEKIDRNTGKLLLTVTSGQIAYEREHLLQKLSNRDKRKFKELKTIDVFEPHPVFKVVKGGIEEWEIIK